MVQLAGEDQQGVPDSRLGRLDPGEVAVTAHDGKSVSGLEA
jgi:hypothetical protein